MVLALIILIGLFLFWLMISPKFEEIGEVIRRYYKELFNDYDEGDEKNEKR